MSLLVYFQKECGPLKSPFAFSKEKFGSGDVFLTVVNIFQCLNNFPLEKGVAPYLTNLNHPLCQVWLNFLKAALHFDHCYLPLEKDVALTEQN